MSLLLHQTVETREFGRIIFDVRPTRIKQGYYVEGEITLHDKPVRVVKEPKPGAIWKEARTGSGNPVA